MRLTVDRDRCLATGQCVMLAPEVFTQRDDDGTSEPLLDTPDESLTDVVREAVAMCPTLAIQFAESS